MRKTLQFLSICILLLPVTITARAQTSARVSLYALQSKTFPTMSAGLDVFDSEGNFVTGLTANSIALLEDNIPRTVNNLEEIPRGVEFALAFDPGPYFAYRDVYAVTRFEKIINALKSWAATHSDSLGDDLSLVANAGSAATHLVTTAAFSDALAAYHPDLLNISSNPETLSRCLDVVSETAPQAGMKPVVLYITSVPPADAIPALDNLAQRAVSQNIRVNVWIVASQDFFSQSGATALRDLAIRTGGQSVTFSGVEPLPSVEMYLAPVRHTYRFIYSSGIRKAGGHTLSAQVNLGNETVPSDALSFDLDVQPPNPILLSPPVQIVRAAPDERTTSISSFLPTRLAINIIIEFPDGRSRKLVSTTLLVDGQKVAENTSEPFDQFIWDLSAYSVSSQHLLTVEVVDSYGLSRVSLGVPVIVTIVRPNLGLLAFLSRNSRWVALVAIITAGLGLGWTLTWGMRKKRQVSMAGGGSRHDPLIQSIQTDGHHRGPRLARGRLSKQTEAYLVRLKDDGQPITSPPIPVTSPEMTFGSDPLQVTRILDDPSVSPLHSRLKEKGGKFILTDEKSIAGTWVNYEALKTPCSLQHGDIVQIGRFTYRFMLRTPPDRSFPRVTPIKK